VYLLVVCCIVIFFLYKLVLCFFNSWLLSLFCVMLFLLILCIWFVL